MCTSGPKYEVVPWPQFHFVPRPKSQGASIASGSSLVPVGLIKC